MRILAALAAAVLLTSCAGAPDSPPPPTTGQDVTVTTIEPDGPVRYLEQLRAQGVPTSVTGQPEIQIGTGICQQIARDAKPEALARDLTSLGWTSEQATAIVTAAQQHLC